MADPDAAPGTVVVTGATGALGSVVVERLSRRGHRVLALARGAEALERLADLPGVSTLAADLRAPLPAPEAALDGPVVAVVHAVGAPFDGGILDVAPEALLGGLDLKVNGLLRVVRRVDAGLVPGARVVALGGNLGLDPTPGAAVPGIVNAALANAVRQLSRAYGPRGVTAHLVAPGPVDTPRLRARADDEAAASGEPVAAVLAGWAAASPLGRLVTPDEVAWAVEVLLAPEAAALAGSTLLLDAGARTAIP